MAREDRKIVPNVTWCYAQWLMELAWEKVLEAGTGTLFQDARLQRLLLRMVLVNDKYEIPTHTLGWRKDFGTTAEDYVRATKAALRAFCEASPPPHHRPAACREDVFQKLCNIFENFQSLTFASFTMK